MNNSDRLYLSKRGPRELVPAQIALFQNRQLLRISIGYDQFDWEQATAALRGAEGQHAVAVGIGGTNLLKANVVVRHGGVKIVDVVNLAQGGEGRGYLSKIEELSAEVTGRSIPIGIAVAGPVDGGRILAAPNLPAFFQEVMDKYGGELARLFPNAAIAMDDVLSTIAASMIARARQSSVTAVVNCTVGSGLGGAISMQESSGFGTIYALEPGHVEVIKELIPVKGFHKACGLGGATFTCVENVASGIGIEALYATKTNTHLNGEELSRLAGRGDEFVTELYANSALLVAHSIIVPAKDVFGLFRQPENTCVAFEGGVHNVPGYTDLVVRTLEQNLGFTPPIIYPYQVPANASLIGASIAALAHTRS